MLNDSDDQDRLSCAQKYQCGCSQLSSKLLVLLINISYEDHMYGPGLLQSFRPAEASQAQQPAAGSSSVGSRICISCTDLMQKTQLQQSSGYFGKMGRSGCEPCERTVKNPAALVVSIPAEYQYFGQDPAPVICLPNVPLHFH